jgi:SAM-dependent methyltransferase
MRTDALQIDRFYQTDQGMAARAMIVRRLVALWPDLKTLDVLAMGYGPPLLESLEPETRRSIAFMPAEQGAIRWPGATASRTVLGEEAHSPFPDAVFDRIILLHALEESQSPPHMLREIWRILAPQGRLALIVPNRAGLWARLESTPLGHGRPFSKAQLSRLLTDAALTPTAWSRALYAPPWKWCCKDDRALGWEQIGEKIVPRLGGLILAEAVKNTGALTPRPARPVRVRLPGLEGRPATALSPRKHLAKED